ncbi:MAG: prepilin-type N-terminal cleavage/methylation domain-containing protein, partial [Verrucomicrobiota bacterium]
MKEFPRNRGFSVIEVLVTIGLSSIFFSAAALIFQNVTANRKVLATIETIQLGVDDASSNAVIQNFYSLDENSIEVYSAPNFGRAAMAANLSENFLDDMAKSSAVFCLGRNGLNTIRDPTIAYASGSATLDTPEAFRQHLLTVNAAAAA